MTIEPSVAKAEAGFEIGGTFYRWNVSDTGKDLMLIDRFTGMPVDEFFALLEDETDQRRAPVILAMIATSVRAGHPDWSIERIVRLVMNTPLSEIVMIEGDEEEKPEVSGPPADGDEQEEQPSSTSPVVASSPSSTPEENSNSKTSLVTLP